MKFKAARRLEGTSEYYFSRKLDEVRKLRAKGMDIINLGIGSPDLAPAPAVIEAATRALNDERNHGYAPYRSSPELRKAMSAWYERVYGVKLDFETEILPLLGSKEGILYTTMAFANPGDSVLVPNPGYPAYASTARLAGATPLYYDLTDANDWLVDLNSLARQDLKNCKMMWVNYPNMPTGRTADAGFFKDLVAFGKSHDILICHDNPYSLVLNEQKPLSLLQFDTAKETCLELNSFSKAFNMAGWRVGMVSTQKPVIDTILQVKSQVDSGMFAAIQAGAAAALSLDDTWHSERNDVYRRRRDLVFKIFDELGFKYSTTQVGLFVWAKAPASIAEVEVYLDKILYEAHVFMVPGEVFGTNGKRYARSSLCADERVLQTALERIRQWKGKSK